MKQYAVQALRDDVRRLQKITEGMRHDLHDPDCSDLSLEFHKGELGFNNSFTNEPGDGKITCDGFWLHREGHDSQWFNMVEVLNLARHAVINPERDSATGE